MKAAAFAIVALCACTDKATPDYKRCVELESKGSLGDARAACTSAVNADPTSNDGRAAAAKIVEIDAKVQQEKARLDAEAAGRALLESKAKDDEIEARCQGKRWATKCMTGHRPDGTEKWTGMQWFDTRAQCLHVTSGAGTCDECTCQ